MIERVISGGQSGADQAGWRAAKAAGISTGGYMAPDFLTEDGERPEFAETYGAKDWPELALTIAEGYRERTRANVRDADATIIFTTDEKSRGTVLAYNTAFRFGKPNVVVKVDPADLNPTRIEHVRPMAMAKWLQKHDVKVLNVAGQRESGAPGIGDFVERYMSAVFHYLNEGEARDD